MTNEQKDKMWIVIHKTSNIILAILFGWYFCNGKENYLEKIPTIAALITAMSLYFAVSIQALAKIEAFVETVKRHVREGVNPIMIEDGKEKNIIEEAAELGSNMMGRIQVSLKGQIIMIIHVLAAAMTTGICERHFDDIVYKSIPVVIDAVHILNSAIILYAICYTLYITWQTAQIVFVQYGQTFKEEKMRAKYYNTNAE